MLTEEQIAAGSCKIRRWTVSVAGYGEGDYLAASRGKAMPDAWGCDAFGNMSFKDFLKIARCHLSPHQVKPKLVSCGGDPVWEIERNSHQVTIAYPDGMHVLRSHPLDIIAYREADNG